MGWLYCKLPINIFWPITCCPGDVTARFAFSCKCLPGICAPVHCPPGRKIKVVKKGDGVPGNCCDEFECPPNVTNHVQNLQNSASERVSKGKEEMSDTVVAAENETGVGVDSKQRRTVDISNLNSIAEKPCIHEGGLYHEGQTWYPNLCTECKCRGGLKLCSKMTCPQLPETCTWVESLEEECCPLCLGCVTEDGRKVNLTESWDRDDCTTCTCGDSGSLLCQTQLCAITCHHPVKVKGRCCPICEGKLKLTTYTNAACIAPGSL